jgi:phosphatidyl-myo-inositol dimannoside synthase
LVKRKGVAWFVNNVMPDLVAANDKIVLVVSGDGPEKSTIEEAVKLHGLKKHVYLLGRTSHDMLKNLYNGSDVFVMPNIKVEGDREGFGRVLLEAALCQLPVVATGIEGIVDAVIGGKNGILVQEKDIKTYVVKLTTLLNDASLAQKTGKAARQYTLKNFDWDNISDKYIAEYRKLS